jgi:hypothetical protein
MAIKASIVGLAALAFIGPVVLFVGGVVWYRRMKQHRASTSRGLQLGEADAHWPVALKQKTNPSQIRNLADVPLVIVVGKRSPSAAPSTSSSLSPGTSPMHSAGGQALLTPPPAAFSRPEAHTITLATLSALQLQKQQQQHCQHADASAAVHLSSQHAQMHCVLNMPVAKGAAQAPPAAPQGVACH